MIKSEHSGGDEGSRIINKLGDNQIIPIFQVHRGLSTSSCLDVEALDDSTPIPRFFLGKKRQFLVDYKNKRVVRIPHGCDPPYCHSRQGSPKRSYQTINKTKFSWMHIKMPPQRQLDYQWRTQYMFDFGGTVHVHVGTLSGSGWPDVPVTVFETELKKHIKMVRSANRRPVNWIAPKGVDLDDTIEPQYISDFKLHHTWDEENMRYVPVADMKIK
ncbi:hypothetical protein ANO11243_067990 [Dothideomycetidae sp. 11243]|nr:hypothetical protein ANO11243_067990 [fungal sp. No.11243]